MNEQRPAGAKQDFHGMGIAPGILAALLKHGITAPTAIQAQTIPVAIEGKDIVGIAQTGTGKTFAFGVPMVQRLAETGGYGLVVVPTRELAVQVEAALRIVAGHIKTAVLIGGVPYGKQLRDLRRDPHIIIATPGRLNDHITQKTIRLNHVSIVVLDEADRMLDMGFLPQIKKIFDVLPPKRQTLLFSATMAHEVMRVASAYMQLPIRIEVAPAGTTAELVTQELFVVSREQKTNLLQKLLGEYRGPTLVFTKTKHGAKKVARDICDMKILAAEIHSNRSLGQRREALEGFKRGKYRVLVATDIASRGIDVTGIELVVNYDLPNTSDDYVHRIGRTARAGAAGHAITFATPHEERTVRAIERLIRKTLPISNKDDGHFVHGGAPGGGERRFGRRPSSRGNFRGGSRSNFAKRPGRYRSFK